MTPEKILDYSIKFGLLPFVLLQLYWYRADLEQTKKDVKDVQLLLVDCYKQQVFQKPLHTDTLIIDSVQVLAVLPEETKIKREC